MVTVEKIASQAEFQMLRPAWEQLRQQNNLSSLFLGHDWFACTLASYSRGKSPCILAAREGDHLLGVAPLWSYRDSVRKIAVQRIGFISNPESPFVDFLIPAERREEALEAILQYLFLEAGRTWDLLSFRQWPEDSPNFAALLSILRRGGQKFLTGTSSITPYTPIQGSWEAFLQERSPRFRKTYRNILNRVAKLKGAEMQLFSLDGTGEVLQDVIAVSQRSWKQKEGIAISCGEQARSFFEGLTRMASQQGWLMIWLMKVEGLPMAMEYDLVEDGKIHALRADFDEAYQEYSPGAYMEYQIIKYLFERGYQEYSFGPGLDNYKLHWTEKCRRNMSLDIFGNRLKGRTLWFLEKRAISFLRRIRDLKNHVNLKKSKPSADSRR